MTHFTRLLLISAAIFAARPAFCSDIDPNPDANHDAVPFQNVCREAGGREVTIVIKTGETYTGQCVFVEGDRLQFSAKDPANAASFQRKVMQISRDAITRFRISAAESELDRYGQNVRKEFKTSFSRIFSSRAPEGLVRLPATVAYTVVTAPFCLLGEMFRDRPAPREITIF
jgi:hypothetical protein